MPRIILFLSAIMIFFSAYSENSPTEKALDYLEKNQTSLGLWDSDGNKSFFDTYATLKTLTKLQHDKATILTNLSKINLILNLPASPETIKEIAIKLYADDNYSADSLLAMQNADEGWGNSADKQSDPLNTSIIVNLLIEKEITPSIPWTTTSDYLISIQNPDGFWNTSDETALSKLEITAKIVRTLQKLNKNGVTDNALLLSINNALNALRGTLQTDGSFRTTSDLTSFPSLIDTAEVYQTLLQYDQPALYFDTLTLL
ncbi:MAG: hypothetical protein U9O87_02850 [Verrucomicrobiota bacterium]|nr:hypothetical protein [Verrucomicrobiota bacterium]